MTHFFATIVETAIYRIPIEAESESEVARLAEDLFINTKDRAQWFECVEDRDCCYVETVKKGETA